jgi:hypothetical protein
MNETDKQKVFLDLAAELTRFYTVLWQSLRGAAGETPMDQMTPDQLAGEIRKIWASLLPRLEKNSIVKGKIEKEMNDALRIATEHGRPGSKGGVRADMKEEASRLMAEGRLKASGFSDLVALFRRM